MRKIEQELLNAINSGVPFSKANTHTVAAADGFDVYLYGHHIAHVIREGVLAVNTETLRNYPTVTTKSRLRALGANVCTRAGVIHLDGKPL